MAKKPKAPSGIYPSYLFRDHDPILDIVQTVIEDSEETLQEVHNLSNVSTATLSKWLNKETKQPQFRTVAAVLLALGSRINVSYAGKVIPVKGTGTVVFRAPPRKAAPNSTGIIKPKPEEDKK